MTIAAGILERYKRYGWSEPPGEWGHLHSEQRKSYHDILEAGDEAVLQALLGGMFQSDAVVGLVGFNIDMLRCLNMPSSPDDFETAFSTFTETCLTIWAAYIDGMTTDFARLHAPQLGLAMVAEMPDGIQIMPDTPRHDHYAQRIIKLLPDGGTVFEIGGGYGGVALQLLRASDNIRVVLCDLPETLYLAWWWLSNATDRTVAWYDDDPSADVLLVPAQERDTWHGSPDLVFAAHSLSEMTLPVVESYMGWVRQMLPRYFYIDQARMMTAEKDDVQLTAAEWPEVLTDDMVPGPPYREVYRAPTIWPVTGSRYWEFLFEREDK